MRQPNGRPACKFSRAADLSVPHHPSVALRTLPHHKALQLGSVAQALGIEPNSDLLASIAWRRTRGARSRSGAPAYSLRRCCSSLSLSKRAASCDNLTAGPRVSLAGPLICLCRDKRPGLDRLVKDAHRAQDRHDRGMVRWRRYVSDERISIDDGIQSACSPSDQPRLV